jgi:hypothetical protein
MENTPHLLKEISQVSSDLLYQRLLSDVKFASVEMYRENNFKITVLLDEFNFTSCSPNHYEFNLFAMSFFVSILDAMGSEHYSKFLKTCVNQILQETESINISAINSHNFYSESIHRDEDFIYAKMNAYIEETDKYMLDPDNFIPNYTYCSIIKSPFASAETIKNIVKNTPQVSPTFVLAYKQAMKAFVGRVYNIEEFNSYKKAFIESKKSNK